MAALCERITVFEMPTMPAEIESLRTMLREFEAERAEATNQSPCFLLFDE